MSITEVFTRKNIILLKAMVSSDFKVRYKQSVLGYLWSVLKPLLLFAIMYMVFVRFLRFGGDVPHFSVGLLLGIIMWNFFSETTTGGMMSVVMHGDLLRKIHFSKFIVVIASSMSALINFGFNFAVVLLFCLINGVQITWTIIFMIPLMLELYMLSLGIGLFLSALFVNLRDLSPIWEVVMQAGFYATPIIYPISMVVDRSGTYGPMLAKMMLVLNPVAQIIQDARHVMISPANATVWQWESNVFVAAVPVLMSALIFLGGYFYFKSKAQFFAELV